MEICHLPICQGYIPESIRQSRIDQICIYSVPFSYLEPYCNKAQHPVKARRLNKAQFNGFRIIKAIWTLGPLVISVIGTVQQKSDNLVQYSTDEISQDKPPCFLDSTRARRLVSQTSPKSIWSWMWVQRSLGFEWKIWLTINF